MKLFTKLARAVLIAASLTIVIIPSSHAGSPAVAAIPADLQQFVIDFNAAMRSRDLERVMAFYSDRYLQDGRDKPAHRSFIDGWIGGISDFRLRLTYFAPIDRERAYIAADIKRVIGMELESRKTPDYQVIKENGQWRWLGNQKASD